MKKKVMPFYFQWDCISPQQDIISENFPLLRVLKGEILPLKLLCFWYWWPIYCKLPGDLTIKLFNFCIIFLLPGNIERIPVSWTEGKQTKPATKKIPHFLYIIFILLWEVEGIKHTFCPRLLIAFNQGLGLVLDKNTRNSILHILE